MCRPTANSTCARRDANRQAQSSAKSDLSPTLMKSFSRCQVPIVSSFSSFSRSSEVGGASSRFGPHETAVHELLLFGIGGVPLRGCLSWRRMSCAWNFDECIARTTTSHALASLRSILLTCHLAVEAAWSRTGALYITSGSTSAKAGK